MKPLIRAATASIACGLALFGATATPALAATGTFHYRNVAEPIPSPKQDPQNGLCIVLAQKIRPVQIADNRTDTNARLYQNNTCTGFNILIVPGDSRSDLGTEESLIAVKFG